MESLWQSTVDAKQTYKGYDYEKKFKLIISAARAYASDDVDSLLKEQEIIRNNSHGFAARGILKRT